MHVTRTVERIRGMGEWIIPNQYGAGARPRMADLRPFAVPSTLDELRGRADAVFELPLDVYWGPRRPPFDMTVPADVRRAYSEIISHGDPELQDRLLNRELLVEHWPELYLDRRNVRPTWEMRFPELRGARR